MRYPKRSQYKYTKKAYRVRNWRAYEDGLSRRGDVTIAVDILTADATPPAPDRPPRSAKNPAPHVSSREYFLDGDPKLRHPGHRAGVPNGRPHVLRPPDSDFRQNDEPWSARACRTRPN